jgi:hypothetical protein
LLIGLWEEVFPKRLARAFLIFLPILTVALSWSFFKPEKQLKVNDNYYLARFFADRTIEGKGNIFSSAYLNYSEDYLPLTVWTKKRPAAVPAAKFGISNGKISFRELSPTSFEAYAVAERLAEVSFHTYFFPGWRAWVDGKPAAIKVSEPFGDISIPIAQGSHLVVIKFTESPIRLFSDLISLVSLTFLLILILFNKILSAALRNR